MNTTSISIQKQQAYCDITGIIQEYTFSGIPEYFLTYTNPIAEKRNFLPISQLSTEKLLSLDNNILSGVLLAILKHIALMDCPLSAAQQNAMLSVAPKEFLIQYIQYFASPTVFSRLTAKKVLLRKYDSMDIGEEPEYRKDLDYASIPLLSLECLLTMPSSQVMHVLKNYKECVTNIIFSTYTKDGKELADIQEQAAILVDKKIDNRTKQLKLAYLRAQKTRQENILNFSKEGRKILKELASSNDAIISSKFYDLLKMLFAGDNLSKTDSELKTKIAVKLSLYGRTDLTRLARIIEDKCFSISTDNLFADENEIEENDKERIEELEQPIKKLSLAEIIAIRKAQNANK